MAYVVFISLLLCLVINFPSLSCQKPVKPPWRKAKQTLLLPKVENSEFYRKLREEIPSKNETAEKLIKIFFRVSRRRKRQIKLEDIVVIMDGSGSIRDCEYQNAKNATKGLMLYEQSGIDARYAAVTFATNVRRDFEFLPQLNAAAKISDAKFPGGMTNTQAGLAEAFELFNTGSRGFNSRKVVLLFTDGQSNRNKGNTIPNARKLKNKGVEILVVAVGNKHIKGIDEMANMATYPPANYLFRVEKIRDFVEIVKMTIKQIAPGKYKILKNYVSTCP